MMSMRALCACSTTHNDITKRFGKSDPVNARLAVTGDGLAGAGVAVAGGTHGERHDVTFHESRDLV